MKLRNMHRNFKFSLCGLSVLVFALLLVFPCSAQQIQTDFLWKKDLSGTHGGNLILSISSDPSNFNRMMTSGVASATIADRLSADLVHINRSNFDLEPSLATKWEVDKTGKIFTIHLRRGVRFSDGIPLTADDVIFSFQALEDPKTEAVIAGQVMTDDSFPQLAKIDAWTLRLTFPRPVGMGLRMLDSVPILPRHRLLKAYQEGRLASAWAPTVSPGEVAGLGPFRLKEYQRGIKVVLERNPYYWKKDKTGQTLPYLDTITFLIVADQNSEALRFQSGELDLASYLTPENFAAARRNAMDGKLILRDQGPGLAMDFLWFNLNRGTNVSRRPYVDPEKLALFEKSEFRRAISFALNRPGMVRSILLGLGTPEYGPITSGNRNWYATGITRTEFNQEQAGALLAQAGLREKGPDGVLLYGLARQPLEISLITARGNAVREKMAQVVQENLSKIGIRVGIQLLLPSEIAARFLNTFDYDAMLFGFYPTDIDPDLQTSFWYSSGKVHFWSPNQSSPQRQWEAEIDTLISRLVRSLDPAARRNAFAQVQTLWSKEMPAIPTIAPNVLVGWSNQLHNVRPSILVPYLLWNAEEISKDRGGR